MILLDANVILRYLLNDHEQMSSKAEAYMQEKDACIQIEVAAEVVYVLTKVYSVDRDKVSESIKRILDIVDCNEKTVLCKALDAYAQTKLDFVDCVLYAYRNVKGYEIRTFDKKLAKILERQEA